MNRKIAGNAAFKRNCSRLAEITTGIFFIWSYMLMEYIHYCTQPILILLRWQHIFPKRCMIIYYLLLWKDIASAFLSQYFEGMVYGWFYRINYHCNPTWQLPLPWVWSFVISIFFLNEVHFCIYIMKICNSLKRSNKHKSYKIL